MAKIRSLNDDLILAKISSLNDDFILAEIRSLNDDFFLAKISSLNDFFLACGHLCASLGASGCHWAPLGKFYIHLHRAITDNDPYVLCVPLSTAAV